MNIQDNCSSDENDTGLKRTAIEQTFTWCKQPLS